MKKMKLQLEALRVESFATAASADARGTVHGNDAMQGSDPIIVGSDNELCTDRSYVETCIFYTCGGCTSDDPAYC